MKKYKGYSLLELMIAITLAVIVIGGVITMYVYTVRSTADTVDSARLNHDLDSVLLLMINDIRRAGYWGGAIAGSNGNNREPITCVDSDPDVSTVGNPFTCGNANIQITNKPGEIANTCILYTYDADGSGINTLTVETDDLDLDEYFGFRLNGDGIDMRYSITNVADAGDCDKGNWENIIDDNKVVITGLTFNKDKDPYKCLNVTLGEPHDLSCATVIAAGGLVAGEVAAETRQVDIILKGQVKSDGDATKDLAGIVKVRNNRIFTQK